MREKRVNLKIPAYVRETLAALETAGHQAYCVGGCVRDSLLGRMPEDWDVTTSALPEETMKVFGDRAIPTGLKHGTVTVCCQEGKAGDHHLPPGRRLRRPPPPGTGHLHPVSDRRPGPPGFHRQRHGNRPSRDGV